MPRLPDVTALGERPTPQPAGGIVGYRADFGGNEAPGAATAQVGAQIGVIMEQLQEKADTTRVEDAWNRYKNTALDLTAGEKGLLKLKGGEAVNANMMQTSAVTLGAARGEIEASLANDNQRRRFAERAAVTDLQVKHQVLSHLASEQKEYDKQVLMGSEAAAKAQISAMPTSPDVFKQARDTLMEQASAYLKSQGVTDKKSVEGYKAKVTDALWATRIDALLYSQPILADAMFRANAKEITNQELKLQLQAKTREAALSVNASLEAQKLLDQTRAEVDTKTRTPRAPAQTEVGFSGAVESLIKREGGYKASDGKSGAPVNFGINQRANPDIDVAKLTKEKAKEIYKTRYWDAIGGDALPPATALVALDAAALQGQEVAKKLIMDADGDPQAMIEIRRGQLKALAARDPEQAKYLPQWLKRMDGLQAEVSGMQKVAYHPDDPTAQNTSGLPNSRDLAAQLPMMEGKVEKRANELYGPDQGNPDRAAFIRRATNELRAKVSSEVQQLNAIQRQAQGDLIDAVTGLGAAPSETGVLAAGGAGPARAVITSFGQIQADPKLMRAWQLMDPAAKVGIERLMEHNLRATDKGDERLYRSLWNRVHLEPGDPQKIDFYQQIIDPTIADRLSIQQIGQLRLEIDRAETPGGRSLTQMRKAADSQVGLFFKTHVMFTAQPDRQIAATMRWNEDVGKKVDEYVKAGTPEKVRAMFMLDTPESVINPKYLQTYVNSTPAQGLAAGAAAAREGAPAQQGLTQEQIAKLPQLPPAIKTREGAIKWMETLGPDVTMIRDENGVPRLIPGRQRSAAGKVK